MIGITFQSIEKKKKKKDEHSLINQNANSLNNLHASDSQALSSRQAENTIEQQNQSTIDVKQDMQPSNKMKTSEDSYSCEFIYEDNDSCDSMIEQKIRQYRQAQNRIESDASNSLQKSLPTDINLKEETSKSKDINHFYNYLETRFQEKEENDCPRFGIEMDPFQNIALSDILKDQPQQKENQTFQREWSLSGKSEIFCKQESTLQNFSMISLKEGDKQSLKHLIKGSSRSPLDITEKEQQILKKKKQGGSTLDYKDLSQSSSHKFNTINPSSTTPIEQISSQPQSPQNYEAFRIQTILNKIDDPNEYLFQDYQQSVPFNYQLNSAPITLNLNQSQKMSNATILNQDTFKLETQQINSRKQIFLSNTKSIKQLTPQVNKIRVFDLSPLRSANETKGQIKNPSFCNQNLDKSSKKQSLTPKKTSDSSCLKILAEGKNKKLLKSKQPFYHLSYHQTNSVRSPSISPVQLSRNLRIQGSHSQPNKQKQLYRLNISNSNHNSLDFQNMSSQPSNSSRKQYKTTAYSPIISHTIVQSPVNSQMISYSPLSSQHSNYSPLNQNITSKSNLILNDTNLHQSIKSTNQAHSTVGISQDLLISHSPQFNLENNNKNNLNIQVYCERPIKEQEANYSKIKRNLQRKQKSNENISCENHSLDIPYQCEQSSNKLRSKSQLSINQISYNSNINSNNKFINPFTHIQSKSSLSPSPLAKKQQDENPKSYCSSSKASEYLQIGSASLPKIQQFETDSQAIFDSENILLYNKSRNINKAEILNSESKRNSKYISNFKSKYNQSHERSLQKKSNKNDLVNSIPSTRTLSLIFTTSSPSQHQQQQQYPQHQQGQKSPITFKDRTKMYLNIHSKMQESSSLNTPTMQKDLSLQQNQLSQDIHYLSINQERSASSYKKSHAFAINQPQSQIQRTHNSSVDQYDKNYLNNANQQSPQRSFIRRPTNKQAKREKLVRTTQIYLNYK